MTRILAAVGVVALLGAPALAGDVRLEVDRWYVERGRAIVLVTVQNRTAQALDTRVECVAQKGLHQRLAMDWMPLDVPARSTRSVNVRIDLHGAEPDRVNCSVLY